MSLCLYVKKNIRKHVFMSTHVSLLQQDLQNTSLFSPLSSFLLSDFRGILRFLRCNNAIKTIFLLKNLKFTTRFLLFLYSLLRFLHKCFLWNCPKDDHPACEFQQTGMWHAQQRKRSEDVRKDDTTKR